jgi:hypothetical protein
MADGRVVLRLGPVTNPIHGMAGCDHKRLMNGNCGYAHRHIRSSEPVGTAGFDPHPGSFVNWVAAGVVLPGCRWGGAAAVYLTRLRYLPTIGGGEGRLVCRRRVRLTCDVP